MSEEKIESLTRDFSEAFVSRDVERMLSFWAEDGVWVSPVGTFRGKEEIRRYLTWDVQVTPNIKVKDIGVGILVKGNKSFYESISENVTPDGRKFEIRAISVHEFSGDKIQHVRLFYDRLSIAKQATKGWLEKLIINTVVSRAEKGLR